MDNIQPEDLTPIHISNLFSDIVKRQCSNIQGIVILIQYDQDTIDKDSEERDFLSCGLNAYEAAGLMEFHKYNIFKSLYENN